MIELLSKVLVANGLNPDSFTPSSGNEKIFRGELPAARVVETWMKLAKAAPETRYWPIIRGALDDYQEPVECDADAVLAGVPAGSIREILQPRMEERREALAEIVPEFAHATDMDELAGLADATGINLFGAGVEEPWPTEAPLRGRSLVLLISSWLLGCHGAVPHRPVFSDFQRAYQKGRDSQAGVEAQIEVFRAAMLSDQEIHTILIGTNALAMIGAGLQGRLDDSQDMALLERATSLSATNSVAWAALAYRSLELMENRTGDTLSVGKKFSRAVESLMALAPSNSVPFYLKAAGDCLETNVADAKELIVKASGIGGFETYEIPLKRCIVQALEETGYSKFTGRIVASGNTPGIVAWSKLNKAILAADPSNEEVRGCLALGARVGRGSSCVAQLVGDSIQMKAMEKLQTSEFVTKKRLIAERRDLIKRAARYLDSARGRMAEALWIQYYDRCFESGEMDAIQWLAHKTGDAL
jgi:hypothetical protein